MFVTIMMMSAGINGGYINISWHGAGLDLNIWVRYLDFHWSFGHCALHTSVLLSSFLQLVRWRI